MGLKRSHSKSSKRVKAVIKFMKWREKNNFEKMKEEAIYGKGYNSGWVDAIKWANKNFIKKDTSQSKGCGKELGNCKCGEPCNICDGEIHLCLECKKQSKGVTEEKK